MPLPATPSRFRSGSGPVSLSCAGKPPNTPIVPLPRQVVHSLRLATAQAPLVATVVGGWMGLMGGISRDGGCWGRLEVDVLSLPRDREKQHPAD